MTAPHFPPITALAVVSPGAAGYLAWILMSGLVALVAVIRVVRRSADEWPHAMWSKVGWVLLVLYLAVPIGGYPVPVGAIAAIWRTRRPQTTRPTELPYANGGSWDGK